MRKSSPVTVTLGSSPLSLRSNVLLQKVEVDNGRGSCHGP